MKASIHNKMFLFLGMNEQYQPCLCCNNCCQAVINTYDGTKQNLLIYTVTKSPQPDCMHHLYTNIRRISYISYKSIQLQNSVWSRSTNLLYTKIFFRKIENLWWDI